MQERSAIERIEILEMKVEILEGLPERVTAVELQLVQLRDEMALNFLQPARSCAPATRRRAARFATKSAPAMRRRAARFATKSAAVTRKRVACCAPK